MSEQTPFPPPERDWIEVLREACEQTSQRQVAARIGSNPTTINQVLRGIYRHPTDALAKLVMDHLQPGEIECPALGLISTARCADEQRQPFASTNPTRVATWRACHSGCPRYRGQDQRGGAR